MRVPSFEMPRTSSLTSRAKPAAAPASPPRAAGDEPPKPKSASPPPPPVYDDSDANSVLVYRDWIDTHFYPRILAKQHQTFDVTVEPRKIGGVQTDVVRPSAGVAPRNRGRVLIDLHAGGFCFGARMCGQLESIPVAGLGQCEVVAVDYRLAPEHRHPAAIEDVVAVYRALLETHDPAAIGIYGYSSGALLSAQTIVRLQQEGLPRPGALALLSGAATYWGEGDSGHWAPAIAGRHMPAWQNHLYLKECDENDPAAFPLRSETALAAFPPTLLATGTRDFALSSVVHTHSQLAKLGVETELHVWEGVAHAFAHDIRLPQSEELFAALIRFFDQRLKVAA
jgi:acetyl esterase/lipase